MELVSRESLPCILPAWFVSGICFENILPLDCCHILGLCGNMVDDGLWKPHTKAFAGEVKLAKSWGAGHWKASPENHG